MAQSGMLIISDITGYSTYVKQSELEHARGSLTDLLNLLIAHNQSPLVIAKLEGDAVFSYLPDGALLQGQSLLELLELTYVAFRQALELMIRNTTCRCNACRNLPNLDLKFFVHHGSFSVQELGSFRELLGHDVNLVHRLAKNRIKEATGLRAYAAYTQALIEHLGLGEWAAGLIPYRDTFADVGEVSLNVQDLHSVWEGRREAARVIVTPRQAWLTTVDEFNVPQSLLWDYVTSPDYRILFTASDRAKIRDTTQGRIGEGAAYVCAHGQRENVHTVVDWQPFVQYTAREETGFSGTYVLTTRELAPFAGGTRLITRFSSLRGGSWLARLIGNVVSQVIVRFYYPRGVQAVRARIVQDLAEGVAVVPPAAELEPDAAARMAAAWSGGEDTPGS